MVFMISWLFGYIGSIFLTSEERHQRRYERRKAKREEKKRIRNEGHSFEEVSSFENLVKSFYQARKGVNWKASVQRYGCNVMKNAYRYSLKMKNGENISKGFIEFDICERGKKRHIKSVHISERVIQKSVCDYGLVPVIEKSLIYDNGASQRGKGTEFASQRLIEHLRRYYRKHGNQGYILLGDQHDFFASIRHDVVERNLRKWLTDESLIDITMKFVRACKKGLGLGSQVCQICAISYQNNIDHYIKEKLRCKYYGRYMDDWYIIGDKEELKRYLDIIRNMYSDIGIEMNEKKTQIVKISHPFVWLQDRYFVTDSGKIIRKASRKSITRNRRKLKRLSAMLEDGKIKYDVIRSFYASQMGFLKHKNAYVTIKNLNKLHNELIIGRWHDVFNAQ